LTYKAFSGNIVLTKQQGENKMKVQFNMVTMKDGKINVEERPELSELLSQSMREHAENSVSNLFTKTKKERAMELDSHWYSTPDSSTFFTAELEQMKDIITDEIKRDKIIQRISEGNKFGTFRRYKTQQPMLVKAYKTRKGASQNTFWRNR
tara:strand:+ start:29 stop:481 length:453 start_codon:yes stop_codon:yes gene_type:complete